MNAENKNALNQYAESLGYKPIVQEGQEETLFEKDGDTHRISRLPEVEGPDFVRVVSPPANELPSL